MSEIMKRNKNGSFIGYILCIVFGIIICIWPGEILLTICRIAGILILLLGIFRLIACVRDPHLMNKGYPLFIGVILCAIGIWIVSAPGTFLKLIPIVIGIVLIYHGARDIYVSIQFKRNRDSKWWISLLIAVLSVVLGLILIRCAFLALEIGMIFLGIMLIYIGVTGLWISKRESGQNGKKIIDVDFKEL